jgi:hypothetical protein
MARALRDPEFVRALNADPDATLAAFDLSDDEQAAILRGLNLTSRSHRLEDRPQKASRLM